MRVSRRSRPVRLRPASAPRPRRPIFPIAALALVLAVAALATPALFRANGSASRNRADAKPTAKALVEPLRDPTPLVAAYRNVNIHLPIAPEDVTAFAFHQASGVYALHMESLVGEADAVKVAKAVKRGKRPLAPKPVAKTVDSEAEAAEGGIPAIWNGKMLRLWRSGRTGAPDTAADCGGKAGTPVFAPVTGTVIGVRRYKLYGKYPDVEVHIQPDGLPRGDCVLIHIDDVQVRKGQRVIGGVTQVASVRLLSDRINHQLATYTGEAGDHVHVQINRLEAPGKLPPLNGS